MVERHAATKQQPEPRGALVTGPYRFVQGRAEGPMRALPFEPQAGQEMYLGYKAIESELLVIEDLHVTAGQLGLSVRNLRARPHSYVDRFGYYKAPFIVAVEDAQHCCRTFASDVLRYVHAEEDALREATVSDYYTFPDRRHRNWRDKDGFRILRTGAEEWLAEERPVFALIREWCGEGAVEEFDQVLALRGEVDRLRTLLEDTVRWLRFSGHPVKATLLARELNKTSKPKQKR